MALEWWVKRGKVTPLRWHKSFLTRLRCAREKASEGAKTETKWEKMRTEIRVTDFPVLSQSYRQSTPSLLDATIKLPLSSKSMELMASFCNAQCSLVSALSHAATNADTQTSRAQNYIVSLQLGAAEALYFWALGLGVFAGRRHDQNVDSTPAGPPVSPARVAFGVNIFLFEEKKGGFCLQFGAKTRLRMSADAATGAPEGAAPVLQEMGGQSELKRIETGELDVCGIFYQLQSAQGLTFPNKFARVRPGLGLACLEGPFCFSVPSGNAGGVATACLL